MRMRSSFVVGTLGVVFFCNFSVFFNFLAFERSRNGISGSAESAESDGAANCIFTVVF